MENKLFVKSRQNCKMKRKNAKSVSGFNYEVNDNCNKQCFRGYSGQSSEVTKTVSKGTEFTYCHCKYSLDSLDCRSKIHLHGGNHQTCASYCMGKQQGIGGQRIPCHILSGKGKT